MSSPQDAPARRKQKARRAKKLAKWREKNPVKGTKPAAKAAAKPATK